MVLSTDKDFGSRNSIAMLRFFLKKIVPFLNSVRTFQVLNVISGVEVMNAPLVIHFFFSIAFLLFVFNRAWEEMIQVLE